MPMGIKTARAYFQRFTVETFNVFIDQKVLQIYLDDFIVNTRTIEEHQDVCNRLLNKMNWAKIKCADKNSKILTKLKLNFWSNTISDNEIYPIKDLAKCIISKPKPPRTSRIVRCSKLLTKVYWWFCTSGTTVI